MTRAPEPGLLPAGAIALSAVLWGLWWLPLRGLAEVGLTGHLVNAALYLSASLALAPFAWRRRRALRAGGRLLLAAGGLFGAALVTWNLALLLGEVVRVTLLFYLAPVWATLLGAAVLGERIGALRVLSVLLGLSGAVVLLGFAAGLPLPRTAGDWLGLAAGLWFALSVTLVRKGTAIDGRDLTAVAFYAAAVLSVLVLIVAAPGNAVASSLAALAFAALASLGWLLPTTWLLLWGARHVEPGRVSMLLLLEVVVAAVSATLLTDESFGAREGAGCLLIIAAGALESASELKRTRRAPA